MDYKEAKKTVQATKSKDNYLVFTLSYDNKIVLPYKDGIAFLNAMNSAEQLIEPYNEKHRITSVSREQVRVTPMSSEEYEQFKIATLLDITIAEVKEFALRTA